VIPPVPDSEAHGKAVLLSLGLNLLGLPENRLVEEAAYLVGGFLRGGI
jgi:hypothetical protein